MFAVGLTAVACGGRPASAATLSCTLAPASPAIGPATLTATLRDRAGQPLGGARIRVEGFMSHPGMSPTIVDAVEQRPGVYLASLQFTMRGDWVLLVSATLADGGRVEQRIDVANVRP
jgi:hypothetical protein